MARDQKSIIQNNVKIDGNIFEKEDIEINGHINGNISAQILKINEDANVNGNIKSNDTSVGGIVKGDLISEKIHITSSADVEGSIRQKILSIEEGAKLKIKSETTK